MYLGLSLNFFHLGCDREFLRDSKPSHKVQRRKVLPLLPPPLPPLRSLLQPLLLFPRLPLLLLPLPLLLPPLRSQFLLLHALLRIKTCSSLLSSSRPSLKRLQVIVEDKGVPL